MFLARRISGIDDLESFYRATDIRLGRGLYEYRIRVFETADPVRASAVVS